MMVAATEIHLDGRPKASTKPTLIRALTACSREFESRLLLTNGNGAHAAQIYILARAIFHPDTQYPASRNVDRLAIAIGAVPTVVVVVVIIVVPTANRSVEGIRSAQAHAESSSANRSVGGVQNNGLASGKLDAFYISSASAVTSLRELATQERGRRIPAEQLKVKHADLSLITAVVHSNVHRDCQFAGPGGERIKVFAVMIVQASGYFS